MTLPTLLQGALSLLLPTSCCACGSPKVQKNNRLLCSTCESQIPFSKPPWCIVCGRSLFGLGASIHRCLECREHRYFFDQALSTCSYEGVAKQLIVSLKYEKRLSIVPFLGELLSTTVNERLEIDPVEMVIPVPLHPVRMRERTFNQAQLLAQVLSTKLHRPCREDLLFRIKPTRSQAELERMERFTNVREVFECVSDPLIRHRRILLVDDVLTTGATASACAKVLKQAGANHVIVATVAHGLLTHNS